MPSLKSIRVGRVASTTVSVLCLRVTLVLPHPTVDLPELESIELGADAFKFRDEEDTELILRSTEREQD